MKSEMLSDAHALLTPPLWMWLYSDRPGNQKNHTENRHLKRDQPVTGSQAGRVFQDVNSDLTNTAMAAGGLQNIPSLLRNTEIKCDVGEVESESLSLCVD